MGYSTDFSGEFKINKPLDNETFLLLKGIGRTRRMKRSKLDSKYGIDGEFYIDNSDKDFGQNRNPKEGIIVNYNEPPSTQPGLWCQWEIQDDKQTIKWDGSEKFYNYTKWIEYLIDRILKPKGYIVNGEVEWFGEDRADVGKIVIKDNNVSEK